MKKTCADCIHYEVCEDIDDGIQMCYTGYKGCEHFKDKSRFIELPCAVGDTVYTTVCYGIGSWKIEESVIVEARKRLGFNLEIIERITNAKGHCTYLPVVLESFGTTKFLTKEDAEKALKGGAE